MFAVGVKMQLRVRFRAALEQCKDVMLWYTCLCANLTPSFIISISVLSSPQVFFAYLLWPFDKLPFRKISVFLLNFL